MVSGPASLVVEDVAEQEQVYAVSVNALRYTFSTGKVFIPKFDLRLPYGSRSLLLGSNGSGKTTLLQILAGKYMVQKDMVRILGRPAFHDMQLTCDGDLSYLGTQWRRDVAFAGYDVPLQGDMGAGAMIYGVEGVDDERRNRLVKLLDIDLNWRLNQVSDGQRRRVQICMGLMKPYKVLLLDEITVDMDVVGRLDLLEFFKQECEERGCCIVYATHIFDGLDRWFTHLAHISDGSLKRFGDATNIPQLLQERSPAGGGKLLHTVEAWLREEREEHRREVASGVRMPEQATRTTPHMPGKHMAFFR